MATLPTRWPSSFDVNNNKGDNSVNWLVGHESGHAAFRKLDDLSKTDSAIASARGAFIQAVQAEGGVTDYSRGYVAEARSPGIPDWSWYRAADEDFAEAHKYYIGYGAGPAYLRKYPKTEAAFKVLWAILGGK